MIPLPDRRPAPGPAGRAGGRAAAALPGGAAPDPIPATAAGFALFPWRMGRRAAARQPKGPSP